MVSQRWVSAGNLLSLPLTGAVGQWLKKPDVLRKELAFAMQRITLTYRIRKSLPRNQKVRAVQQSQAALPSEQKHVSFGIAAAGRSDIFQAIF